MHRLYLQICSALPHVTAAVAALIYAWWISETALFDTGLQFVSPFAIVIAVHLAWFTAQGRLQAGFAQRLYSRALGTAVFMFAALILGSVFAPKPAYADAEGVVGFILVLVFCAAVIAAVVWVLALVIKGLFFVLERSVDAVKSNTDDDDPPQNRLFDVGSLTVCFALIAAGSLEGLPKAYRFAAEGTAGSTIQVETEAGAVWQAMQTATSPAFPLPAALGFFPQPVAVPVDEGVALGANRVVAFAGREGAGNLHLRVTEASDTAVVFDVISDTTPYAGWISFKQLTYQVHPVDKGTELSVNLTFDRRLAPAWFFGPVMKSAAYLAANVLVRDVAARSVP